jgi:UDP:flavonoid glycosyltransferase YjiC (YdhE family)
LKQILNILICPLEWGLGHAGRMIALAAKLRTSGHNIIIGAGEEHQAFFMKEIPGLSYINFPGYKPTYSKYLPQYMKLLLDLPVLVWHIIREHRKLKKIVREHRIDIVISDNRFGLWNKKIKSVYVTHMPRIPFPAPFSFLEFIGVFLHRMVIRKYSLCFIPDLPGELNISGRLSHGLKLPDNTRYVGLLSRFSELINNPADNPLKARHNTVILSGPEPQREILRKKLTGILMDREPVTVFLGGKPGGTERMSKSGNILWFDHLPCDAMKQIITTSDSVIARAGYTAIVELISLGRSAILIPTPGQTEQEYLACRLSEKGWFSVISQRNINDEIPQAPEKALHADLLITQSRSLLDSALNELLIKEQD